MLINNTKIYNFNFQAKTPVSNNTKTIVKEVSQDLPKKLNVESLSQVYDELMQTCNSLEKDFNNLTSKLERLSTDTGSKIKDLKTSNEEISNYDICKRYSNYDWSFLKTTLEKQAGFYLYKSSERLGWAKYYRDYVNEKGPIVARLLYLD